MINQIKKIVLKYFKNSYAFNILYIYLKSIQLLKYIEKKIEYNYEKKNNLIILGAGPSINYFMDQYKKDTKYFDDNFDFLSLSFSIVLDIKYIKYYFLETPGNYVPNYEIINYNSMIDKANIRFLDNNSLELYWKSPEHENCEKLFNLQGFKKSPTISILTDSENILSKVLIFINKRKYLNNFLFQKRGSAFSSIFFGIRKNYSNIILVGIDMYSTDYFFELNNIYEKYQLINSIKQDNKFDCKTSHPLSLKIDPVSKSSSMSMQDSIKCLNNTFQSNIYVNTKKSLLSKHLKLIDFDNEEERCRLINV